MTKPTPTEQSLRDLVEEGAARYGKTARIVWRMVLEAMLSGALPIGEATLDKPFDHGGSRRTWREIISLSLNGIDRADPGRSPWTTNSTLDSATFSTWLDKVFVANAAPIPPKRLSGAKPTRRQAIAAFINKKYSNPIPAHIKNQTILDDYKNETGIAVSDRTLRRALGRR